MTNKDVCLCVHGHFYQPPRENAWIEAIELQGSAAPFHDWNERIYTQCYLPNTLARVLDQAGSVVDIVNNFESMSFNFGPTLIAWIADRHPDTYERILEADRVSRAAHGGHGNAIAQVYNHLIMPLASRRDKVTQVKWGMADFRHRFGREPESVWLAETACNEETLEVLVEEGVRYLILEPHQAEAVRPLDKDEWRDVSEGGIDPKRAYRAFLKKDPSKSIDVFFYDGPISKAVGFEDLVFDAKRFMDRIASAKVDEYGAPQLVNLSTDGETYGHHKAYGDRVLAYLLNVEAPARGFAVVNYAEFLDANPPRDAVRIKAGENGEGTSWSCAHGVRRWRDNCGCRGDGPAEWSQEWRKPLREAFDWLRDELARIYEEHGGPLLKDVWAARDAYIDVILDRSEENVARFFRRHGSHALARPAVVTALKLLEIQRHAMLMYTSCGWFFTELSGIETVQVIQYAARAIQLAEEVSGRKLEEDFIRRLSAAKSNIPEYRDGGAIYERFVKPAVIPLPKVAAYFAIGSIFDGYYPDGDTVRIGGFDVRVLDRRKEAFGGITLNIGRVTVRSRVTSEEETLAFAATQTSLYDFRAWVKPMDEAELAEVEKSLFAALGSGEIVDLFKKTDAAFGEKVFMLKNLLFEDRLRIISLLTRGMIEKIDAAYENLYDENVRMSEVYRAICLPVPEEIRYAAEHTLSHRLEKAVEALAADRFELSKSQPVYRIMETAAALDLALQKEGVRRFLSRRLSETAAVLFECVTEEAAAECRHLLELAQKIGVSLDEGEAQNRLFGVLRHWSAHQEIDGDRRIIDALIALAGVLHVNTDEFKKAIVQVEAASNGNGAAHREAPAVLRKG